MCSGLSPERFCLLAVSAAIASSALAETYDKCLLDQIHSADENLTLKDLRKQCEISTSTTRKVSPVAARVEQESETRGNRFTLTPHRANYILPVSFNNKPNADPFREVGYEDELSSTEIKFQISVKAPLSYGVFNGYGELWVAYTNTSWWQAYNSESAPFRETNHEPEVFFVFPAQTDIFGLNMDAVLLGFSHQSNGKIGALSRSWNRLYANFVFTKDNLVMSIKPWWRIPEEEKETPTSSEGDDNPDIHNYMGYGELTFVYKLHEHNIGMMIRNNLRKDNKGAVQLNWSFPINDRFRGYVQYFNGYGESLIDYNDSTNRISIGVMLTDLL